MRTSVTIAKDGTVSITTQGNAATTQIGTLQVATFVNPAGLQAIGENLFLETAIERHRDAADTRDPNGAGTLNQNYVEASNVNVAEELVGLIQTQRGL